MNADPARRGALLVLAAAVLWGSTGTAQAVLAAPLSPLWVGAMRLAVAALFFVPLLAPVLRGAQRLPLAGTAAAAACMCAYNLAFFAGVGSVGVAVGTAVAIGSAPIWAGVLQAATGQGWPSRAWWIGTGVAVAGLALMVLGPGPAAHITLAGIATTCAAGLSYAAYTLINRRLVDTAAPGTVTAAVFGLAALLAAPMAAAMGGVPATATLGLRDAAVLAWLGVVSTGVAYLLFSHGLKRLPGATAVSLALAEPLTAFVLAVAIVGEHPDAVAIGGAALLLAGLWLLLRAPGTRKPARRVNPA